MKTRRPTKVSNAQISEMKRRTIDPKRSRVSSGGSEYALGIARVVSLDFEDLTVTLRTLKGDDQSFQRVPVAMSFPGVGKRHFFGALPEIGDLCIFGNMTRESGGGTKTPVILGWIVPGTWVGHDWMTTGPYAPEEFAMTPKEAAEIEGAGEIVRHKLRHMKPGNIVASSSQGSDLVLDESVLITNRRGNEILLRDQDQAIVSRSLQNFQVSAGARIYSGMVQRDSTHLPTQMFSDGLLWDGNRQVNRGNNEPFKDSEYLTMGASKHGEGFLTPDKVFDRIADGTRTFSDAPVSGIFFEENVDPFLFLQRGLFISKSGYAYDSNVQSDAAYGGKTFFRPSIVSDDSKRPLNAAIGIGQQSNAVTEHRIELAHTSDGRLPVSEQTDGLDVDRLPRSAQNSADAEGLAEGRPFIESVLGSVIGNDPFTQTGRAQYGLPLLARVFNADGARDPKLESGISDPLGRHAATLFRMTPPSPVKGDPTFFSVAKDGRVYVSIGGPVREKYSAEVALNSGIKISTKGVFEIVADGGLALKLKGDKSGRGIDLSADDSAVRIYAGGESTAEVAALGSAPVGGGLSDAPSLYLGGKNNVLIDGSRSVVIQAATAEVRCSDQKVSALSTIQMSAGEGVNITAKTLSVISNGKATYNFNGPKDFLPTNGAFRETTFVGLGVGPVDNYTVVQGDRKEMFLAGNRTTVVGAGSITMTTAAGAVVSTAGTNSVSVDSVTGINAVASTGGFTASAVVGSVFISGQTSALVRANGPATLSGSVVTLGAVGKIGGIVSQADLDPLTGQPLALYGMGSPGHLLGSKI